MAGKNTIQILRGKVTDTNKSEKLLEGQPFYNEDKNYLTIGRQGGTASLDSLPITVRELVGYVSDSDKITNIKTNEYSLKYSNADNSLKITSPRGVDIDSGNGDVTLKRNNNSSLTLKSDSIEYANNSISASVAVNIITPSTAGFVFKDSGGGSNLATVEMGKLKLNALCDANGTRQASISGNGIAVDNNLTATNIGADNNITAAGDITTNAVKIRTASVGSKQGYVEIYNGGKTKPSIKLDGGNNPNIVVRDGNGLTDIVQIGGENIGIKCARNVTANGFLTTSSGVEIYNNEDSSGVIHLTKKVDGTLTAIIALNAQNGLISATSFNAVSDKRLKENIVEYSPNKSILDLPIYSYNFISDEKKTKKIGCLAQDLKEICPEIVKEDDKGYLSIEESKIVYLLLDEVKKLKKRVDELEAR
jgi:hypothetical protein